MSTVAKSAADAYKYDFANDSEAIFLCLRRQIMEVHCDIEPDTLFELDPFITEIARRMDREVLEMRLNFRTIDTGNRVVRICAELRRRGVRHTDRT
jgi:hypothetical protein